MIDFSCESIIMKEGKTIWSIVSGIAAALICLAVNPRIIKDKKKNGIMLIVPLIEEFFKTLIPLLLNTAIVPAHLVFGLAEAFYEMKIGGKKGIASGIGSVSGHTLFGIVALKGIMLSGSVSLGILIAAFIHICWNIFVFALSEANMAKGS